MEAVATRPPLDQDHLQKKHFRFKISIHAYLVLFCYAVLSLQNCIFSAFVIGPLQPKVAIQNSVKNPDETLWSLWWCVDSTSSRTHDLKLENWTFFYSMKPLWTWKLPTTTSNLELISYWNSNLTGTILESSQCNCHLTKTWLNTCKSKEHLLKDTRDA